MCGNLHSLAQSAVAEYLNAVVLGYVSVLYERLHIDFVEVALNGQCVDNVKVDRLVLHPLQVCETVLRQAPLQRHLTALETELAGIA